MSINKVDNDGDGPIMTRPASNAYREGYDRIFGGFKPRVDGGVVRSGQSADALFHGDAITLKDGVITRHVPGVVYEVASEAAYWAMRSKE